MILCENSGILYRGLGILKTSYASDKIARMKKIEIKVGAKSKRRSKGLDSWIV